MVKGTTRSVILVKSPDPKIFEEAIFIVKEDAKKKGVTSEILVREAQEVASEYIRTHVKKNIFTQMHPAMFAAAGAGVTGILWAVTELII